MKGRPKHVLVCFASVLLAVVILDNAFPTQLINKKYRTLIKLPYFPESQGFQIDLHNKEDLQPEQYVDAELLKTATANSSELLKAVKLLCFVETCGKNRRRARAIRETWAKRCDKTLFISDRNDSRLSEIALPNVLKGYRHLWSKTVHSFLHLYQTYLDKFHWFLKSDDDNYVIVENLKAFLAMHSPLEPHYFGKRFRAFGGYNSGGGGYVLSREALRRLGGALTSRKCLHPESISPEDLAMGRCLKKVGVIPGNTLDTQNSELFHALNANMELKGKPPDWFPKYSFYPVKKGFGCCSNLTISFHYMTPGDMLQMEFFLYHLTVFGSLPPQQSKMHNFYSTE